MSGIQDELYSFPEEIDLVGEHYSWSLSDLLEFEGPLQSVDLSPMPSSQDQIHLQWEINQSIYHFNLDDDSPNWADDNRIEFVQSYEEHSEDQQMVFEPDLSHSILYTTDLPSGKLGEEEEGPPDRPINPAEEQQIAYISDLLRNQQDLSPKDTPFEKYKAPRNDRIIKVIRRMLKVWVVAIAEYLNRRPEDVLEVLSELKNSKDIEGIRRVMAKEGRKWLLDQLARLFDNQTFLTYAISKNPHLNHEDKTLLWDKLPALRTMVTEPAKLLASWDPKRIDKTGNHEQALKLISSGKATYEQISLLVNEKYEQTKHLFDSVKCSKKNNIYNFWNNVVVKALLQLKQRTVNMLLAEEIEKCVAKLKDNRSLQGITSVIGDKSPIIWHLQKLHESYELVGMLLQERTNTQMMKSLIDTYPVVIKKLLNI